MYGITRTPIDLSNGERFDFYVDSVRGSDSNDGSSRGRAFASLAPLTAMGTVPDETRIGFARGSVFDDSVLELIGNDLYLNSYGASSLDLPFFNLGDSLSSGGWTKTVGRTNVYQRTITLPNSVKAMGNIYEDGIAMTQFTTNQLDNVDSTPRSAYVTDWTASSATLYIHCTGSGNPASNGKTYSYTRRLRGIFIDGDRAIVKNLHLAFNAHQDGSIVTTGEDCVWQGLVIEDGCRHAALSGAGLQATGIVFRRAANYLETSSNLLVVNQAAVIGKSYTLTQCEFDGENGHLTTAVSNHGANSAHVFDTCYHIDCTYKNMTVGALSVVSNDLQIVRPVLENIQQFAVYGADGTKVTITNGSGDCNQLIKGEVGMTDVEAVVIRNDDERFVVPNMSTFGFINFEATTGTNSVTVEAPRVYIESYTGNGDFIRVKHGTVTMTDANIGPNRPTTLRRIVRLGQDGGTGTYVGSNNRIPYGPSYLYNGTDYGFTLFSTTFSQESGSTQDGDGGTPSNVGQVFFTDLFNRSDENLEANANWTRIGGSAGQAAIRSNKLSMIGTTQTAYRLTNDIGQKNYFLQARVEQVPASGASFPLAFRIVDQNNYLGFRWSSTQWQAFRCVANVFNGFATVTPTTPPAVGDIIRIVVVDLICTCYINEVQIFSTAYNASAMDNSFYVGCVPRSAALDPAIDSFIHGYA